MSPYMVLAVAGAGLAVVVALVAVLTRHLIDRHADAYAAEVRAAASRDQAVEYAAAVARIKELAR